MCGRTIDSLAALNSAARRAGEAAFRPQDWRLVMTAKRCYPNPEAG